MPSQDRFDDLRARLDATEAVLRLFLEHASFEAGAAADLKAAILRYAAEFAPDQTDNPLSNRQAEEMRLYASRVPERPLP